jgi:hypothetical protein
MISNSYSFFNGKAKDQYNDNTSLNNNFEEEFLGADFSVNVKDYVAFPKMSDLMVEIVPFVQYKKTNSEETIRMTFRAENSVKKYKNSPLYIIDGVMTRSTDFFLKIKPDDVLIIKIINNPAKLVQLGKLGENGIIFIESKNRNLSKSLAGQNLFSVVGLSSAVLPFSIGNMKNRNYRSPDLRSTLYWNPLIKTSSSGKASINFSASDDVGKMRVLIKGLTEDGRPFSTEKELEVGFQSNKK